MIINRTKWYLFKKIWPLILFDHFSGGRKKHSQSSPEYAAERALIRCCSILAICSLLLGKAQGEHSCSPAILYNEATFKWVPISDKI